MIRKSKKSYLVSAVAEAENADNKTSKLWQTLRYVRISLKIICTILCTSELNKEIIIIIINLPDIYFW